MKKDIHPNSRKVLFKDIATDETYIISSSVETNETTTHEGVEYPMVKVEISSSSHPFTLVKRDQVVRLAESTNSTKNIINNDSIRIKRR